MPSALPSRARHEDARAPDARARAEVGAAFRLADEPLRRGIGRLARRGERDRRVCDRRRPDAAAGILRNRIRRPLASDLARAGAWSEARRVWRDVLTRKGSANPDRFYASLRRRAYAEAFDAFPLDVASGFRGELTQSDLIVRDGVREARAGRLREATSEFEMAVTCRSFSQPPHLLLALVALRHDGATARGQLLTTLDLAGQPDTIAPTLPTSWAYDAMAVLADEHLDAARAERFIRRPRRRS